MANKLPLPDFASEGEEAAWYFKHQDELDDYFSASEFSNTRELLAHHDMILPQDTLTAVLSPEVLAQVEEQAQRKGLERNQYIERLITSALQADKAA